MLSHKEAMSITEFENKLITDFKLNGIVKAQYIEPYYGEDKAPTLINLYYDNEIQHIASYANGEGWILQPNTQVKQQSFDKVA